MHFPKSSTIVSSVPRIFAQKAYYPRWDNQDVLANVRQVFVFFLVSSGFCLGTLPWMPFLSSLFLIVESWTLTLLEASKACSSLDVVLGSFMTSWMSHHCALGVILVGQPTKLGRFTTIPSCLYLWIMALTMVRWSPKSLEMALEPFPDWYISISLLLICYQL